jgi:mannose-6-phosphate isomerase-like protein (cupin superfamily)
MTEKHDYQRFRPNEIARSFPEIAETLLMDTYLTDEAAASARVFRVCRETPPHFHAGGDEYLYVLSGRGTFWMGDASNGGEFAPGDLLFFKRRIVHALPKILEAPLIFLSFDTPRRDPKDIIFVNPEDGTPESFIRGKRTMKFGRGRLFLARLSPLTSSDSRSCWRKLNSARKPCVLSFICGNAWAVLRKAC